MVQGGSLAFCSQPLAGSTMRGNRAYGSVFVQSVAEVSPDTIPDQLNGPSERTGVCPPKNQVAMRFHLRPAEDESEGFQIASENVRHAPGIPQDFRTVAGLIRLCGNGRRSGLWRQDQQIAGKDDSKHAELNLSELPEDWTQHVWKAGWLE